jgi:hypothetical protein
MANRVNVIDRVCVGMTHADSHLNEFIALENN